MSVKKGQELELVIETLAFGGKGIAKVEGMAVFVDQAIPGDRVLARVYKRKKNYAEAGILELIDSSKDRIKAPCLYFGVCGGCKLQCMNYEKQLWFKQRHIIETLAHIAMQRDLNIHPTLAAGQIYGYRNKMEFTCSDRRWLMPDEMAFRTNDAEMAIGLHVPGTYFKVLDIENCHLQPDLGNQILKSIREYIKKSSRPIYGLHSHTGFWRFVMLRHSNSKDQWMVNIVTAEEDRKAVLPLAEKLCDTYPEITSVMNNITARRSGVAIGEQEYLLAGKNYIVDNINGFEFEISANSFFQTNTRGAALLYDVVKSFAQLNGSETVLDLYCGTGTIAIYLSNEARRVTGIEVVDDAVADAKRNCRRNRISNCDFICSDVKEGLGNLEVKPDVMIIDPPRVGMHDDVVKQVLQMAPPKIVYVSCNPATLARDIALMQNDYTVEEVQPVDMFPHTFHIEAVAKLKHKNG